MMLLGAVIGDITKLIKGWIHILRLIGKHPWLNAFKFWNIIQGTIAPSPTREFFLNLKCCLSKKGLSLHDLTIWLPDKTRHMITLTTCLAHGAPWVSYQIRKLGGCPCAGNAGNVFHMSGSLTSGLLWIGWRENVPGIPGACATRNFTYLVRGTWRQITATPSGRMDHYD